MSRNVSSAKLEIINARLKVEQSNLEVNTGLMIAFQKFQDQLSILKLEQQNIFAAKEIFLISQERFKTGLLLF